MSPKKTTASGAAGARRAAAKGARRSAQSPPIVRVMVVDALESWVVPALAGATAATLWVLDAAGVVGDPIAVDGIALSLLVLSLFVSLRRYFFSDENEERYASWIFAAAWTLALFAAFHAHNVIGAPLASGVLRAEGEPLRVPAASRYAIVVDGHFTASSGQGNRAGQYRLELGATGETARTVAGAFDDTWSSQRLGRRGSTRVEIQHTSELRQVAGVSSGEATLRLAAIDATLVPEITVTVYRGIHPWILPVLGVIGVVASLAFEKRSGGDGAVVSTAAISYLVVDSYLRWGSPHAELRSLIGAVLIGGIIGGPLAALLWRVTPKRWFARA